MTTTSAPLPPSPLDTWPPHWEPSAVIFDCDGILVDTESQWVEVQDAYLARHGAAFDAATRRAITGRSADVVIAAIAETVGKSPEDVVAELLAAHRADLDERLTPMPGALELVRAIAALKPVAIASNSPRDMLDRKIEGMGLVGVIDASVSTEDVAEPKPAPDMYLAGARLLGAAPADALAFEDSETGAEAANAAGVQLIAVPSIPGQAPIAPRTLASLEDRTLRDWVATWTRTR